MLVLPVLTVFSAWLPGAGNDLGAFAVVREMFATVLPGYIRTTVALGLMVALGSAVVGTLCAAVVTLFDFRGRKTLEWLLLLPLAMPAVLAGFLLAFTLSLDNTIIAAFVQVSGTTPWPVYVLSALRSGLRPEIAAVSTIMLLLTLVALAVVALVLRRAGDSATQIARTMTGG